MRRRIRGLLGTALIWGAVGVAIGAVLFLSNYKAWPIDPVHWKRSMTILAGFIGGGALWGGASGVAFGLVLLSAERNRGLQQLSKLRMTAWGAVAGVTFPVLLYTPIVLQGAYEVLPLYALTTGLSGIAGAVSGLVTFALARRAPEQEFDAAAQTVLPDELNAGMPFVTPERESSEVGVK